LLSLVTASLLAVAAIDAPPPASGAQVVQQQCKLCHGPGIGGAPRIGDRAAWTKRLARGFEGLVLSAAAGRVGLPPRGGLGDLTDEQLRAAGANMLNLSGANGGEEH
jgi:cytochrome c5